MPIRKFSYIRGPENELLGAMQTLEKYRPLQCNRSISATNRPLGLPPETSRWQSPAPGHYAIYGKQPLSGCQTISLEGASLFCCCFLQSFLLWIPDPTRKVSDFQMIFPPKVGEHSVQTQHFHGKFRAVSGSILYHWATLSRPPFSFDAKMRLETWQQVPLMMRSLSWNL